jgi:hypothetical protein
MSEDIHEKLRQAQAWIETGRTTQNMRAWHFPPGTRPQGEIVDDCMTKAGECIKEAIVMAEEMKGLIQGLEAACDSYSEYAYLYTDLVSDS